MSIATMATVALQSLQLQNSPMLTPCFGPQTFTPGAVLSTSYTNIFKMVTTHAPNGKSNHGLVSMLVTQQSIVVTSFLSTIPLPVTQHHNFHVVFNDQFQTVAPHLSLSTSAEIDHLFETLWTESQWPYDGNIPPEYLFLNNINLHDMTTLKMTLEIEYLLQKMTGWPLITL